MMTTTPGLLTVIVGATGTGRSWAAAELTLAWSRAGGAVFHPSLHETSAVIADRLLTLSGIAELKTRNDCRALAAKLSDITIPQLYNPPIADLADAITAWASECVSRRRLVVIDRIRDTAGTDGPFPDAQDLVELGAAVRRAGAALVAVTGDATQGAELAHGMGCTAATLHTPDLWLQLRPSAHNPASAAYLRSIQ